MIEDNKIDYSIFLRDRINENYNFIVFYVSTDGLNNYDNIDRVRSTGNIEGNSDVFIIPFGKIFITNKYISPYSTKYYYRLVFDDISKTISIFYRMYSEHIVINKIIVF